MDNHHVCDHPIAIVAICFLGIRITDVTFDGGKVNVRHTNGIVKIYDGVTGKFLGRTWRPCIPFREKPEIESVIFSKGEVTVNCRDQSCTIFEGVTGLEIGAGQGPQVNVEEGFLEEMGIYF